MNTVIVYFSLPLHGPNDFAKLNKRILYLMCTLTWIDNFAKPKRLTYTHVDILKSIYPSDTPIYIVLDSYVSILLSVCVYGCLGLLLLLTPVLIHHVEHPHLPSITWCKNNNIKPRGNFCLCLPCLPRQGYCV